MQRLRGGLVFKAHRLVHHSTLGVKVISNKKEGGALGLAAQFALPSLLRLAHNLRLVPRRARI